MQLHHAPLLERRLADPAQAAKVYSLLGELRREGSPIVVKMPGGWRGWLHGFKLALSLDRQSRRLVRPGFAGRILAMSNITAALVLVAFAAGLWAAGVKSWASYGPLAMLTVLVFTVYAVAGAAIITAVTFGSISVEKRYSYRIGFLAQRAVRRPRRGGGRRRVFLFLMLLQLVFRQNLGLGAVEAFFLVSGPAGLSLAVRGGAVFSAPVRLRRIGSAGSPAAPCWASWWRFPARCCVPRPRSPAARAARAPPCRAGLFRGAAERAAAGLPAFAAPGLGGPRVRLHRRPGPP